MTFRIIKQYMLHAIIKNSWNCIDRSPAPSRNCSAKQHRFDDSTALCKPIIYGWPVCTSMPSTILKKYSVSAFIGAEGKGDYQIIHPTCTSTPVLGTTVIRPALSRRTQDSVSWSTTDIRVSTRGIATRPGLAHSSRRSTRKVHLNHSLMPRRHTYVLLSLRMRPRTSIGIYQHSRAVAILLRSAYHITRASNVKSIYI